MRGTELVESCCVAATWYPKSINFLGTSVDYPASELLPYSREEVSLHI